MNAYNNSRKGAPVRWKRHKLMQVIEQDNKRRRQQSQRIGEAMLDVVLNRVAQECGDPNCPLHGTQARAHSN